MELVGGLLDGGTCAVAGRLLGTGQFVQFRRSPQIEIQRDATFEVHNGFNLVTTAWEYWNAGNGEIGKVNLFGRFTVQDGASIRMGLNLNVLPGSVFEMPQSGRVHLEGGGRFADDLTVPTNAVLLLRGPVRESLSPPTYYLPDKPLLDRVTRTVTWRLQAIDPETLDLPISPFVGFLPPDRVAPEGQGFVSFSVRAKPDLPTGTRIDARGTIVFDTNAPIDTNAWTNTLDDGPPTSSVSPLPATANSASFSVSWSGTDAPGGSGIGTYDVVVSDNGGPFTLWQDNTTQTSAAFTGQEVPSRVMRTFVIPELCSGRN